MNTYPRTLIVGGLAAALLLTVAACPGGGDHEGAEVNDRGGASTVGPAALAPVEPVEPGPDSVVQVDLDGLLPADRQAVWHPGLTAMGGIPHRETVCTTLEPSGGDDTGAIQQALNTCPAGQVVQLGDGEFRITGYGLELTRSEITLRGNGPEHTRLVKDSGTDFGVISVGNVWYEYTQPTDLNAGAAKGARTVELVSDPGLQVGEIVIIDQLEDPDRIYWNPFRQPPGDPSRSWFVRDGRPLGQVVEIKTISGNTVELTTPLHTDFRADLEPQLYRFSEGPGEAPVGAVRRSGIEDLYVYGGEGGDCCGNVHLFAAAYSWLRNVESEGSIGASVALSGCFRCEVRDSYLHSTRDPNPGGGGYGLVINEYAADNLVENNIMWNFNKPMVMRSTGGGNVIAYNYLEDGWISYDSHWPESGLLPAHFGTPSHELLEGNLTWNLHGDTNWGNSIYITAFRNHLTGHRRSVPPLQFDSDDLGFRRVVSLEVGHWWYSFLGNVLGTADQQSPNGFEYEWQEWPDRDVSEIPVFVWVLGYADHEIEELVDVDAEAARVQNRTIRHGNFDFVTRRVHWDPAIDRRDLPGSFYLAEPPAFFGDHAWPWVTAEDGGRTATLPARERFDRIHDLP